ncbi:MAG: SGNH/GDSL hydrolase family protein [Verrucomicrobia bacterium]|nr:SGNH/GDSL hydrolase family protein [Verrucomicrobiota bacterium]
MSAIKILSPQFLVHPFVCGLVAILFAPSCTTVPEAIPDSNASSVVTGAPNSRASRELKPAAEVPLKPIQVPKLSEVPKLAEKKTPERKVEPIAGTPMLSNWRNALQPRKPEAPASLPDPAQKGGKRVLFLGDSLGIGAFGRAFDQGLRDAGFEVFTSVAGGATPYYWLKEYPSVSIDITYWERTPTSERRLSRIGAVPKVEALMSSWNPDIVVVQTGTNLYASLRSKKRSKEANVREVESLTDKMCRVVTANGQRQIYWITPPDADVKRYPQALQDEMLSITQRVAGQYGTVFNSYQVTSYGKPDSKSDGIHLTTSASRSWGKTAASDFKSRFQ